MTRSVTILFFCLAGILVSTCSAFRPRRHVGLNRLVGEHRRYATSGLAAISLNNKNENPRKRNGEATQSVALNLRGGSVLGNMFGALSDAFMNPIFWAMAVSAAVCTYVMELPPGPTINNLMSVYLAGYFFYLLVRWQKSVEAKQK